MRANMRQFSASNKGGKFNSSGGYKAGDFARGKGGKGASANTSRSTSGS